MKVLFTKQYEVYAVSFYQDMVGREKEEIALLMNIDANIQANDNKLQITQYGDRILNTFDMYSNHDIAEDNRVKVDGKLYQIISKQKYDTFEPTHYVYTLELM